MKPLPSPSETLLDLSHDAEPVRTPTSPRIELLIGDDPPPPPAPPPRSALARAIVNDGKLFVDGFLVEGIQSFGELSLLSLPANTPAGENAARPYSLSAPDQGVTAQLLYDGEWIEFGAVASVEQSDNSCVVSSTSGRRTVVRGASEMTITVETTRRGLIGDPRLAKALNGMGLSSSRRIRICTAGARDEFPVVVVRQDQNYTMNMVVTTMMVVVDPR